VLDRFAHASHNAIVLGQTGTGKTMFTGAEMSRCLIRGIRVLGADPLGDYRRLAAELGGTYLDLAAQGVALPGTASYTSPLPIHVPTTYARARRLTPCRSSRVFVPVGRRQASRSIAQGGGWSHASAVADDASG
jgi:hypothetical protein